MSLQALRDALAAVPAGCRRVDLDRDAAAAYGRLQALPLTAGDLPPEKLAAVMAGALEQGLAVARRLRGMPGYEEPAAVLYGLMAGLTGLTVPTGEVANG